MKNSILFSFILLLNISFCFAGDISLSEKLKMVKGRDLIVEIPSIDDKYVNKLKSKNKTEEVNNYMKSYEEFVKYYKKAFTNYCKIGNGTIIFKTFDELNLIIDTKSTNYAILRYVTIDYGNSENLGIKLEKDLVSLKFENATCGINEYHTGLGLSNLSLYLCEDSKMVSNIPLNHKSSVGGIITGIKLLQNLISNSEKYSDTKISYSVYRLCDSKINLPLENMMLYVRKDEFLKKTNNFEKAMSDYPYPYKVVSIEEWDQAFIDENPKVVCLIFTGGMKQIFSAANSYLYFISVSPVIYSEKIFQFIDDRTFNGIQNFEKERIKSLEVK
jgi:hypothetical protein